MIPGSMLRDGDLHQVKIVWDISLDCSDKIALTTLGNVLRMVHFDDICHKGNFSNDNVYLWLKISLCRGCVNHCMVFIELVSVLALLTFLNIPKCAESTGQKTQNKYTVTHFSEGKSLCEC